MKPRLPFIFTLITGAIGKHFIIKHYKYGVVMTRYPNMKNIIPTEAQKMRRRLFRKAVKYAQSIYANPALKEEKRKMLRRPKRFFQALMKEWFKKRQERQYWNTRRLKIWKQNIEQNYLLKSLPSINQVNLYGIEDNLYQKRERMFAPLE